MYNTIAVCVFLLLFTLLICYSLCLFTMVRNENSLKKCENVSNFFNILMFETTSISFNNLTDF